MLRHYLIIRSEGVPLFSFTNRLTDPHYSDSPPEFNPQLVENPTLFSGLLSSFVSFGKELGGSLQQIKLDNIDLYMYEQDSLIGVTLADPTNDPVEIDGYKELTQMVTNRFLLDYQQEIQQWDGNVTKFKGFKDRLSQTPLLSGEVEPANVCKQCLVDCCSPIKDIVKS